MMLMAALAAAAQAVPQAGLPETRPYVQSEGPGSITLVWRVQGAGEKAVVRVEREDRAAPPTELEAQALPPASGEALYQYESRVDDLSPGRWYRYRVSVGRQTWLGRFLAPRGPEEQHTRFVAIADMGTGSEAQGMLARQMEIFAPEYVVAAGDVVYPDGAAADYGKHFFTPYAALIGKVPFYAVLGNHDVRTENGAPLLKAFALPAEPGGERYYSFRQGPAQFWGLDSTGDLSADSAQLKWLAADAAASRAPWKIAFFHHPPYSTGLHGGSDRVRRHLAPLLEQLGFDLVITGHDHHYERFAPRGKTTWIVTGGGGGWPYRASGAGSAKIWNGYQFTGVTIEGNTLGARAIDVNGVVRDAWSIRKSP